MRCTLLAHAHWNWCTNLNVYEYSEWWINNNEWLINNNRKRYRWIVLLWWFVFWNGWPWNSRSVFNTRLDVRHHCLHLIPVDASLVTCAEWTNWIRIILSFTFFLCATPGFCIQPFCTRTRLSTWEKKMFRRSPDNIHRYDHLVDKRSLSVIALARQWLDIAISFSFLNCLEYK